MKINVKQAGGPQQVAVRFAKVFDKKRKALEKEKWQRLTK